MEPNDLDSEDWAAIENCLAACAHDRREPERYRTWYADTLEHVRSLIAARANIMEKDGQTTGLLEAGRTDVRSDG